MNFIEKSFRAHGVDVNYVFRKAQSDNRSLLVVFTGFESDYNFKNVLSNCRANILWIKDSFSGECAYYLCQSLNFSIEKAVSALIASFSNDLSIAPSNCIALGVSKGGSAALYFGLKLGFKNIVSLAPQFNIANFTKTHYPSCYRFMVGEEESANDKKLNSLLIDTILQDTVIDKNIYLISSTNDEFHGSEIVPNVQNLYKYENFNLITSESEIIYKHNQLGTYCLPITLSLLYSLTEGIKPRIGNVIHAHQKLNSQQIENKLYEQRGENIQISNLTSFYIRDGRFFPEGDAFIKGYTYDKYSIMTQFLVAKSNQEILEFPLGVVKNRNFSTKYYDTVYCDYSYSGFASPRHLGHDIDLLPEGVYQLSTKIVMDGVIHEAPLISKRNIELRYAHKEFVIIFTSNNNATWLAKKRFLSEENITHFEVKNKWYRNNIVHYEGIFSIKGLETEFWSDIDYYLILKSKDHTYSFEMGKHDRPELIHAAIAPTIKSYRKSYFSTPRDQGINVENVSTGDYMVFISLCSKGEFFTESTGDTIQIS